MGAAGVLAGVQIGGAALSAYQQVQEGKAQASYYSYLAGTAKTNADLALATGEAERQGIGMEALSAQDALNKRVRGAMGSQKAAIAAGGAGLSSRTAQDILSDTMDKGNLDELALRTNTYLKQRAVSIGSKMQAMNYMGQARGYEMAGKNVTSMAKSKVAASLLGGAGSVGSNYYMMTK